MNNNNNRPALSYHALPYNKPPKRKLINSKASITRYYHDALIRVKPAASPTHISVFKNPIDKSFSIYKNERTENNKWKV